MLAKRLGSTTLTTIRIGITQCSIDSLEIKTRNASSIASDRKGRKGHCSMESNY